MTVLEARAVSKSFGGNRAVDGVSLAVNAGEIVGLSGPNGAGKSVLVGLLAGRDTPDEGVVLVDGKPASRQHHRIFSTYQLGRVFPFHTLEENLQLGTIAHARNGNSLRHFDARQMEQVAGTLSVGERRRVALRWLETRVGQTAVFLLDEPTAGGDAAYIRDLMATITAARDAGAAVLVVEHNRDVISAIADREIVMDRGQIRNHTVTPCTLTARRLSAGLRVPSGEKELAADRITVVRDGVEVLRDASIAISRGEIVGLAGRNGGGKSSLLRALYGDAACTVTHGAVLHGGQELASGDVGARLRGGIHFLPQEDVTFRSLSPAEFLRLSADVAGVALRNGWRDRISAILPHIQPVWDRPAGTLSGGERRLVGLARIALLQPRFALLDEPTAGLDASAIASVGSLLHALADRGAGVLIVEQNVAFLNAMCSRTVRIDDVGNREAEASNRYAYSSAD